MEKATLPNDYAIDALALEVDRQNKKRGTVNYSYGKLVADTTCEQRQSIADRYARKAARKNTAPDRYREPDDEIDIRNVLGRK